MRFKYTEEHLAFLREGYKTLRRSELTAAFNEKFGLSKTTCSVKQALQMNGIRTDRKGLVKGERSVLFTPEQVGFIKEKYKIYSHKELTIEFNKTFQTEIKAKQIRSFVHNQGIQSGRNGCFGEGHKPWNAGTKGLVKPNSGNFKKGQVPPNLMPVGSERVNVYGYVEIKINVPNPYVPGQKTRWKQKHHVVWESVNGPVPKNHLVTFLDGNKENCDIENLELISRGVNAYINCNGYADLTGDLKKSVIALAKVAQKTAKVAQKTAQIQREEARV